MFDQFDPMAQESGTRRIRIKFRSWHDRTPLLYLLDASPLIEANYDPLDALPSSYHCEMRGCCDLPTF
jgi:hypothetical protein